MFDKPNIKIYIMKKRFILSAFLLIILCSIPAQAQNSPMSGNWKLDKVKTAIADNNLFLSRITVQLKKDSILTTRVYENANGEEYPFVENLTLDGKDCKITIYDMPRTSKASRASDGGILIESKTTFYGNNGEEDMIAKEAWKVDKEGKVLSIDSTNSIAGNESKGISYYNKVK